MGLRATSVTESYRQNPKMAKQAEKGGLAEKARGALRICHQLLSTGLYRRELGRLAYVGE